MKDLVDSAAKYVGVASIFVLFVSVVHETGYFSVIGSHLQAIATTYDYLANALVWLPTALGALLSLQAIEQGIGIKGGEIKLGGVFYFSWALAALGIAAYLLFGGVSAAFAVISFIGFCLIYFMTRNLKIKDEALSNYRLVVVGVYLTVLSYGYGVSSGYSDLTSSSNVYAIEQKDATRVRQLVLLRIFEKGILVRDLPAQKIELLRWESINNMWRFLPKPNSTDGYLCTWFEVACRKRGAELKYDP